MACTVEKLNIMQWNARSAVAHKKDLCHFLNNNNIHVALISETWFKSNQVINFPNYNLVRRDRYDGKVGGGVAVLVNKQIPYKEITFVNNFNSDIQICGVTIKVSNSYLSIVSLYNPPKTVTQVNDWTNIFKQCASPCIIGGDFNGHNASWGSSKTDDIGRQIINSLENLELSIMNDGSATRLTPPSQNKSVVDITMISSTIAPTISWKVNADTLGSDHFVITMEVFLNLNVNNMVLPKYKWNTNKADWPLYENTLLQHFNTVPTLNSPDEKYSFFMDGINEAANVAIPVNKPFKIKKRPPPPWWDLECNQAIQRRKNALNNFKQNFTMENYMSCKKEMALVKKTLNSKARLSWKHYCEKLNRTTPYTELWKQAKRLKRLPAHSKPSTEEKWIDDFFDQVAPPSVSRDTTSNSSPHHIEDHFFSTPFTIDELNCVIKSGLNTAPGYDEVNYPMLAHLPKNGQNFLLDIFNEIWTKGATISSFKTSVIVPDRKSVV